MQRIPGLPSNFAESTPVACELCRKHQDCLWTESSGVAISMSCPSRWHGFFQWYSWVWVILLLQVGLSSGNLILLWVLTDSPSWTLVQPFPWSAMGFVLEWVGVGLISLGKVFDMAWCHDACVGLRWHSWMRESWTSPLFEDKMSLIFFTFYMRLEAQELQWILQFLREHWGHKFKLWHTDLTRVLEF